MTVATALWRRLDAPGHDSARLTPLGTGWRLEGTAVFQHEGVPAQLGYRVDCDAQWITTDGAVHGWVGDRTVRIAIQRSATGIWTYDGVNVAGVEDCLDLDLGFTPATNALQLRRTALKVGEGADVPVAWLDVDTDALTRLHQRYERRLADAYWYHSPTFDYTATITVDASGFARDYPELWVAES